MKYNSFLIRILFLVMLCIVVIIVLTNRHGKKHKDYNPDIPPVYVNGPAFVREGALTFLNKNKDTLTAIDIEIADDEASRMQGLMYRSSMEDKQGMLFIFDKQEPQSFWMKNTKIPLDIIYIDENKKIVSISENTIPFSEEPIPSGSAAKFVVEVNAGFCGKNKIDTGNYIHF
jgi:uncharacterized protein